MLFRSRGTGLRLHSRGRGVPVSPAVGRRGRRERRVGATAAVRLEEEGVDEAQRAARLAPLPAGGRGGGERAGAEGGGGTVVTGAAGPRRLLPVSLASLGAESPAQRAGGGGGGGAALAAQGRVPETCDRHTHTHTHTHERT